MAEKSRRSLRVADLIKNELGWIIERYLKDLNQGLITITNVKLSSDLRLAYVYFSVISIKDNKENLEDILKKATPFIRNQLASRIKIKYIPDIRFMHDNSAEYYSKIDNILKKIHEDENN